MTTKKSQFIRLMIFAVLALLAFSCETPEVVPAVQPAEKKFDYSELYGTDEYDNGIIFYGDSRKHHDIHIKIAENVFSFDPAAVFHLGDAVSDGDNAGEWEDFDTIVSNLRAEVPFYPVIGNHEKGVDPVWYMNHWDMSVGQGYYSLNLLKSGSLVTIPISDAGISDYSGIDPNDVAVHISVLHSNPSFLEENEEQYNWLIEDLEQFQDIPSILVFHIPLYCAGEHHDEMGEAHPAKVLYSVLEDPRFDIIACVNGHDHAYERFAVNNISHIVTGCGGESPYEILEPDHPYLEVYEPVHHISVLKYDPLQNSLKFTAFDIDLNIIDSLEIGL